MTPHHQHPPTDPDARFIEQNIHPPADAARLLARLLALKRALARLQVQAWYNAARINHPQNTQKR